MIYIGKRMMVKPYLGTKNVKRVYLGTTVVWSDVVRIYYTLSGVTCNGASQVDGGASFSATLTGETGKQVDPLSVVVMMGSTDITDTAYDWTTNTISIASVTGEVSITADGITMDSAYKPIPYVTLLDNSSRLPFTTDYYACEKTKMDMEVAVKSGDLLWANLGHSPSTGNSASRPKFALLVNQGANLTTRLYNYDQNVTNSNAMKVDAHISVSVDCGVLTYPDSNGVTRTITTTPSTSYRCTEKLTLFGFSANADNAYTMGGGVIYRWKIWEEGTLLHTFVPVERVSDGYVGLYDITQSEVVEIKPPTYCVGPTTT